MRFMLVSVDIYHRPGELMRPDYLSQIGADLYFNKLTRTHFNFTSNLRENYPPVTGTMLPANMPGFRGPVIRSPPLADDPTLVSLVVLSHPPPVDPAVAPILTAIQCDLSGGHHFNLHVYPKLNVH